MKHLTSFFIILFLSGCAAYKPVPDGYTGPVATVADSGFAEGATKAQMYVLTAVDGNNIRNSLGASASSSYGQGFALTTNFVSRPVPAIPMKASIRASHTTGAPIHAIFSQMAGTFFSVEGIVDFTPLPGGQYIVKGELKREGSSVWIEDSTTGKVVTTKVTGN
jgi:hypothetical protein